MDAHDFRILQAMGFAPYLPDAPPADAVKPARIAKRVGLGLKAVKERIARMEREGVIAGYDAYPNLRHFPFEWKSFHFRVPEDAKPAFVRATKAVEGVIGSFSFVGRDVCIDVCYQDAPEMKRRVALLKELAGGAAPWEFYDNPRPPVARELTPLDWRIVRALRHDAKRSGAAVAKEVGVTARTVKDRTTRMIDEGSLWIVPRIDAGRMTGSIPFALLLYARPDAARGAMQTARKALADEIMYAWSPPAAALGNLVAILRAPSLSEVERVRVRASKLDGMERVELLLPTAMETDLAWLDEAIERKVSGNGPGSAANGRLSPGARGPRSPRGR